MARSDYSQLLLEHLFATYTPFITDPKLTHFVCAFVLSFLIYHHQDWVEGARVREMKGESPGGQRGGMLQATVRMSCI